MYCNAEYGLKAAIRDATGETRRTISTLKKDVAGQFSDVAKVLERIEKRLDDIEQATVDPQGEAAQKLRKRHGMGKPNQPVELHGIKKKG
tara:strand:+ start:439 stop:708 length:270 start_codon:yes stop_codon:yes gene_type:complete